MNSTERTERNLSLSIPEQIKDIDKFPIGTRVRVVVEFQDMYFFRGNETGTVIRNTGDYMGVIVKFDKPRYFEDDYIQYDFNFNPVDLEIFKIEQEQ